MRKKYFEKLSLSTIFKNFRNIYPVINEKLCRQKREKNKKETKKEHQTVFKQNCFENIGQHKPKPVKKPYFSYTIVGTCQF